MISPEEGKKRGKVEQQTSKVTPDADPEETALS